MKIRRLNVEDLELISTWLEQSYIREYWGEPSDWLTEITENISADWVQYFIVETAKPIGFLQYYETDKAPSGEWSDEPAGTVGIDYLIGDPEYLGKGYGTQLISLFVEFIKSANRYKYIVADPVSASKSSVKVLDNNGFRQKTNRLYWLDLRYASLR